MLHIQKYVIANDWRAKVWKGAINFKWCCVKITLALKIAFEIDSKITFTKNIKFTTSNGKFE